MLYLIFEDVVEEEEYIDTEELMDNDEISNEECWFLKGYKEGK